MKFVYQTKLEGTIEAPITVKNSIFALKACALCPTKSNIFGIVLGEGTEETVALIRKTGARLARKGLGISLTGAKENRMSYKKVFADEIENIGEEFTSLTEFDFDNKSDDEVLAVVLGNILFGNAQTVTFKNKIEDEPYFADALGIISSLGGSVERTEGNQIKVSNSTTLIGSDNLYVDGDWNIGAFGLMCSALGYGVNVTNLYTRRSNQPSAEILKPLQQMGLRLVDEPRGKMFFADADYRRAVKVDAQTCPDVLPYIVCLATQIDGETEIYNITEDVLNANDRALFWTAAEFKRLGFEITANRAGTIGVKGRKIFDGGVKINCRNNLSLSFAAILATLCSRKSNVLENCEIIDEKYPDFWETFKNIGGFSE